MENKTVNNFKTKVIGLKDRVEDKAQYLAATTAVAISSNPVLNTVRGFAAGNNQIKTKAPKVDKSGNVTFDGPSNTDPQTGVAKLLENGQFWVGVVAGFAALILIGTGIWQAMKASKLKMEGNQEAYKMASNVMIGAFIGGALMAAVAAFLAIGVVQGNNFFGGGGSGGGGGATP